jgi:hypothetical protein
VDKETAESRVKNLEFPRRVINITAVLFAAASKRHV